MANKKNRMLSVFGTLLVLLGSTEIQAQRADTLPAKVTVAASTEYLPNLSSKGLAGKRYRMEWAVPVQAPVALLDTLVGGLRPDSIPLKAAAELYLHDAQGHAFVLKPLQQTPASRLPDIYQGTIIADFANDLGSAYHPYAPLAATALAQAAGLQVPPIQLFFIPVQKALGAGTNRWGNQLFFLQKRLAPAGVDTVRSWVSTRRLFELLEEDRRNRVDAAAYLRYRMLDMLLGVTDRREDGWRWLAQPNAAGTTYLPVPQGYESAFALYEGRLMTVAKIVAPVGHLVSFDHKLEDPAKFASVSLHLDRRLTSGLSAKDWQDAASGLRASLTDEVLQASLRNMPKEVQVLSGNTILAKLKSRRKMLEPYTRRYYELISRHVDVLGSASDEQVRISGDKNKGISIQAYGLDDAGKALPAPFFNRTFSARTTKEVNLYGMGGNDQFLAEGEIDKKIRLRIIGGPQQDSLLNNSSGNTIQVYDTRTNTYGYNSHSSYHLRNDAEVTRYDFDAFAFNKKGLRPMVFYNNNDRLYAGITYNNVRQGWRKTPFAQRHKAYVNYSLWQGGISAGYEGVFNQIIGRWNGMVSAEFDAIRWNNFFGIGNESPPQVLENDYHRVRSAVVNADAGLFRPLGKHHSIGIAGRFQTVRIRPDMERFVAKTMSGDDPLLYRTHQFGGGRITYSFQKQNDPLIPTGGFVFNANAGYSRNLKMPQREVMNYGTNLQFYIPLGKRWVWSTLGGLQAVTGNPEFYQLATIGGTATLRGFRRERFWGKTAAYNQNELMYHFPFRSYQFNGTVGLYGLFDAGRIWQPLEVSEKLHTGYGLGLMVAPFHKIRIEIAYARSSERGMLHIGYRGNL